MSEAKVCGDVDAGSVLVVCECGKLRQTDRYHAFCFGCDVERRVDVLVGESSHSCRATERHTEEKP